LYRPSRLTLTRPASSSSEVFEIAWRRQSIRASSTGRAESTSRPCARSAHRGWVRLRGSARALNTSRHEDRQAVHLPVKARRGVPWSMTRTRCSSCRASTSSRPHDREYGAARPARWEVGGLLRFHFAGHSRQPTVRRPRAYLTGADRAREGLLRTANLSVTGDMLSRRFASLGSLAPASAGSSEDRRASTATTPSHGLASNDPRLRGADVDATTPGRTASGRSTDGPARLRSQGPQPKEHR